MGFFKASQESAPTEYLAPQCNSCGLYKQCKSPKMPVTGKGEKGILIISDAPGAVEDVKNEHLIGEAGQILRGVLRKHNIDLDRDCWKTDAIICRPPSGRTPTKKEISWCRPNLTRTLKELNPVNIIPLGSIALESLLGPIWKDKQGYTMERWNGWNIPCQELNAWVSPTWHPSFIIQERTAKGGKERVKLLEMLFDRQVGEAVKLIERPWEVVPDYEKRVDVLFDEKEAAERIMLMTELAILERRSLAFDFETTTLKPDSQYAQIICCSMSDGKRAICFRWKGKAERAAVQFIKSSVKKTASNLKMEDRWVRRFYGQGVPGWEWDSTIAAHVLDCRGGITGLKFQSFVVLGQSPYNKEVEDFIEGEDGMSNTPNRLKDMDERKLMLYCGMDSLVEAKIAKIQMKQLGYDHE